MTITAAQFAIDFPEFANATTFPPASIDFWLNVASLTLNAQAWGALLDMGTELFVAHHMAIAARDQAAVSTGGMPGTQTGPTASKAVDKVSVSYDTASAAVNDAGFWNLTSYGTRFLFYSRMVGAGGLQQGMPGPWPGFPGNLSPIT